MLPAQRVPDGCPPLFDTDSANAPVVAAALHRPADGIERLEDVMAHIADGKSADAAVRDRPAARDAIADPAATGRRSYFERASWAGGAPLVDRCFN